MGRTFSTQNVLPIFVSSPSNPQSPQKKTLDGCMIFRNYFQIIFRNCSEKLKFTRVGGAGAGSNSLWKGRQRRGSQAVLSSGSLAGTGF